MPQVSRKHQDELRHEKVVILGMGEFISGVCDWLYLQ